jgi:hypothetical protein
VKVNVEQAQVVDVGAFHPAQPGVLHNLSEAPSVLFCLQEKLKGTVLPDKIGLKVFHQVDLYN